MQNRTLLVLLRPIFSQKMKTAPPEGIWVLKCEGVAVIRQEEPCEFSTSAEKSVSISAKTFFFWRSPVFGRKNCLNFRFRPKKIFWKSPVFGWKNRSNFRFWPKNPSQFRRKPFFLEITCLWAEKPFEFPISTEIAVSIADKPIEFESRGMKIPVKVANSCLTLTKKPPPPF